LCAGAYRVDNRHRRYAAPRDARRRQLAAPDHGEMPSALAVGTRRDEFGD